MSVEIEAAKPATATVRLWDKDYNLMGTVHGGWRLDEPGTIALPLDDPLARQLVEHGPAESVHLTVDRAGDRFSGRLSEFKTMQAPFNVRANVKYLKAIFAEDAPMQFIDYNKLGGTQ